MMRRLLRAALTSALVLGALSWSAPAPAQERAPGSLRGTVVDKDFGSPLDGARVAIMEARVAITTGTDGAFLFPRVPAGSYTLWTLPSRAGWKLIINRQTGQWGTEYHAEQDLVRVDLERRGTPGPVELFTILIEPTGANTAALRLSWDDTELVAPIAVH